MMAKRPSKRRARQQNCSRPATRRKRKDWIASNRLFRFLRCGSGTNNNNHAVQLMTLLAIAATLLVLVLLITRWQVNPFLSFLVASILAGVLLGVPPADIPRALEKGIGDMLGSIVVIVCLGAMFGKLIADSGAAQAITQLLMGWFGQKYLVWALMVTGFVVGIPLFYNVGFVLLVPL